MILKILFALALMGAIWWLVRPKLKGKAMPDVAKARAILGVGENATPDDVRAAHRRLASGVHPDKGGSTELTRQINDARDVLLRRLK